MLLTSTPRGSVINDNSQIVIWTNIRFLMTFGIIVINHYQIWYLSSALSFVVTIIFIFAIILTLKSMIGQNQITWIMALCPSEIAMSSDNKKLILYYWQIHKLYSAIHIHGCVCVFLSFKFATSQLA